MGVPLCSNNCPAGYGLATSGATVCTACVNGTFNAGDSQYCSACPRGQCAHGACQSRRQTDYVSALLHTISVSLWTSRWFQLSERVGVSVSGCALVSGCRFLTGQASGPAAAFCCPAMSPSYATSSSAYVDTLGIEGAHSCLVYTNSFSGASSVSLGNAACVKITGQPTSHMLTSQQMSLVGQTPVNGISNGALSAAATLAYGTICPSRSPSEFGVGASTPSLSSSPTTWAWTDGTNATNVNCGSNGCGQWWSTYPSGPSNEVYLFVQWHVDCLHSPVYDNNQYTTPAIMCEMEVCPAGTYLPNPRVANAACVACPAGTRCALGRRPDARALLAWSFRVVSLTRLCVVAAHVATGGRHGVGDRVVVVQRDVSEEHVCGGRVSEVHSLRCRLLQRRHRAMHCSSVYVARTTACDDVIAGFYIV